MANELEAVKNLLTEALAATVFIHTAKRFLGKDIYAPAVEEKIFDYTRCQAEERSLAPEALVEFMRLYCQCSREIQTHWQDQGDEFEYSFSEQEETAVAQIKEVIPAFADVTTLNEIRGVLTAETANALLQWGRGVIGRTNGAIFNAIAEGAADHEFEDSDLVKNALTGAVQAAFNDADITAELEGTLGQWTQSLTECKNAGLSLSR